jgi:hypothetical protein
MMKFRKKPIVIEAVQMPTSVGDLVHAPSWLTEAMKDGRVAYTDRHTFTVQTLEGVMAGSAGDFVIQGIKGELYPCKREIFITTYERTPSGVPMLGS